LKKARNILILFASLYVYTEPTPGFHPMNSTVVNRCFVSLIPSNTAGFYGDDFNGIQWISRFFTAWGSGTKKIRFNPFFSDGL
jgi:hypothetical protein